MKPIKLLKKWLLGMFITVIPVVIAACYGPFYEVTGKVVDSKTQAGISGIEVTCVNYNDLTTPENEAEALITYTGSTGYYEFENTSTDSCAVVKLRDVDGTTNGTYIKKSVYVTDPANYPSTIEMRKLR
jgi:putative lipoprotein (rSAM/lipoprotein system)